MKKSIFILILSAFLFGINEFAYAQWTTIDSIMYYNSGSIGIGTANPVQKLHVNGNIQSLSNFIKSTNPYIWFDDDDQILNKKKWLIAAYNGNLQFQPRNDDYGYTGNSMYLRRDLSVFFGNNIDVTGNIITNGRNIYFGEAQKLFGDNLSALYYSSNSSTATQLILRDKEGKLYGRLFGNGDGVNFGLLDGDGNWSYLAVKDSYTGFRINNSEKMRIQSNGNVGIGTTNPQSELAVNGTITSKVAITTQTGWSDFVFKSDYQLPSLQEIEAFIIENGHLPDVPSEDYIKTNGNNLGETDAILLQKIEELTLYMIELDKKNIEIEKKNKELEAEILKLKNK